jgi:hypothetical protein
MSRGPRSAETRANFKKSPHYSGKYAETGVVRWKDSRVKARAAAKRELDAVRTRAIKDLAHQSRADAKARGLPQFTGLPCSRHVNALRNVSDGRCIHCNRERLDARRGIIRVHGTLREIPTRGLPRAECIRRRPIRAPGGGFVAFTETALPIIDGDDGAPPMLDHGG